MVVTQEELLSRLQYREGHLWWVRPPKKARVKVGDRWGSVTIRGYVTGMVCQKRFQEHRLIWLYHYGVWPVGSIDHVNGIKHDNRIENLREATFSENAQNKKGKKNTTSKYKGVSWCKQTQKWRACIKVGPVRKTLGRYETEQEAAIAYDDCAKENFGQYALLNFKENK